MHALLTLTALLCVCGRALLACPMHADGLCKPCWYPRSTRAQGACPKCCMALQCTSCMSAGGVHLCICRHAKHSGLSSAVGSAQAVRAGRAQRQRQEHAAEGTGQPRCPHPGAHRHLLPGPRDPRQRHDRAGGADLCHPLHHHAISLCTADVKCKLGPGAASATHMQLDAAQVAGGGTHRPQWSTLQRRGAWCAWSACAQGPAAPTCCRQ